MNDNAADRPTSTCI